VRFSFNQSRWWGWIIAYIMQVFLLWVKQEKKVSNSWPLGLWKLRSMENVHICVNGGIFATAVNFLGLLRAWVERTCLWRE
jgi:hypothetical protein